jgi:carbamoylphosphate synthase large subunit
VHRGVSIIGKIVKNNTLIRYVKNLSKKLKFNGPINIQVILDKNKKICILEVNPRLSGSIEFSIKAGFNPLLYYKKNKKKKFNSIKYNKIFKRFYALN